MDILFAAIPAYGHVFPLLPLASACADAGHEVRIATGEPFLDRLPWPTVRGMPVGAGLDEVVARARRRHPLAQGPDLAVAMFADVTAELVAGELDRELSARRPDLVVFEAMNVGAAMAADVHDVPAVGFSIGLATGGVVDMINRGAGTFRADFWTAHGRVPPAGSGPRTAMVLDPVPPSLTPPGAPSTVPHVPIRSVAFSDPAGTVHPRLTGPRIRPAIYLTLGTVSFGAVEVIRRAVDQIARLDVDLLVAVGPDGDPDALGSVPENVDLERFVDQPGVLDRVAVAVHHGGTGTVLAAAAAGVPQLILPQGADQFLNGDLIERVGIGRALTNDRQDGDAIARSVRALLGDGPERSGAARVRAEIAAMPAPELVVPRLVALARG